MNELTVFNNEEFGEIRTITIDGEPWFVAADVCVYFGVSNRNRIMQSVDAEDKGGTQMDTPGGVQTVAIVNESGLYSVLFALQPNKARGVSKAYIEDRQDKLHRFKRWVTHDILPTIRKTGGYMTDELLAKCQKDPNVMFAFAEDLLKLRDKTNVLESKLDVAQTIDSIINKEVNK